MDNSSIINKDIGFQSQTLAQTPTPKIFSTIFSSQLLSGLISI